MEPPNIILIEKGGDSMGQKLNFEKTKTFTTKRKTKLYSVTTSGTNELPRTLAAKTKFTSTHYILYGRGNSKVYYEARDSSKQFIGYVKSEDVKETLKQEDLQKPANKNPTIGSASGSTTGSSSTWGANIPLNTSTTPTVKQTIDLDIQYDYDRKMVSDLVITDPQGIHGMPYQFMESVDRRLKGSKFGRKYSERIVSRMPLLLITPGEPNYLTGFSAQSKSNVSKYLSAVGVGDSNDASLSDILKPDEFGRYFTLDFAYKQYYQYVNSMLRQAARFLNIAGRTLPEKKGKSTPLWKYDWSYNNNGYLPGVLSSEEYVAFYVESEANVQEQFSNQTSQSLLSSTFSKGTDMVNEFKFIMGSYGAGIDPANTDPNTISEMKSGFDEFIANSPLTNNRLIQRLYDDVSIVVSGGKIIFPEIWSDSSFSRNYSVDIKLRTPDNDTFSWYMNIFVPLAHLICLAAPRQVITKGDLTDPNSYSAPFLIRCFYKGIFSIEMGLIDSLSITKGNRSAWTVDGLPTEVDVSLSLKDLYDVMAISRFIGRSSWKLIKNTAMTDYIATSCGCNINKPDIRRVVDLWLMQRYNAVADIPRQAWMGIQQSVASGLYDFMRSGKITF